MKKRVWSLVIAALLLVGLLVVGVFAAEETTTVTFAPYTDADGVRQYCACGNKFVADANDTVAYVNGENGCKNHKENGEIVDGCDGTLISWNPLGANKYFGGVTAGTAYYLTANIQNTAQGIGKTAGNYYIDLNGFSLTRNDARVMVPLAGAHVYITDTSAQKNGFIACVDTNGAARTDQGCTVWLNNANSSVTLFDGTIDGSQEQTSYSKGGTALYMAATTHKFSMFGGAIKSGTVTGGNSGVALINGTFNLYGGQITGGSGVKGGAIYVSATATLNMTGGKIVGGAASDQGCAVYNDGTVNMSGGEIVRGTDTAQAVVYNVGSFTITGGTVDSTTAGASAQKGAVTVSGGTLTVDGGTIKGNPKSIYTYSATLNIYSGTIGGNQLYINGTNSAPTTVNVTGGTVQKEIYVVKGIVNISGNPKVQASLNFADTDQKVNIGTLTEGADVLVRTLKIEDAVLPYYTLTDATALNYIRDGDSVRDLYWIEGEGLYVGKYNCSVCGGVYSGCDHAEKVKYTPTAELPTESGHYYLTADVETDSQLTLAADVNVVLDLNGRTVSRAGRVIGMNSAGAILTITDTSVDGSGVIKSSGNGTGQGKVLMVNNAAAVANLYAGTLDASGSTNTNYGGAVSVVGAFHMYGGHVIGGGVVKNTTNANYGYGGAVAVGGGHTFTMCGGTITGGEAKLGGAIGLKSGAVAQITGGSIISGRGTNGTAIYVSTGTNLLLQDAAVVGGTSGTTIWNCGVITLSGKVDMPEANFDIMIDCRNGESYLDVAALTQVTDPISVRRWEQDTTNDDTGLLAANAAESHVAMFEAKKADFYEIQLTEGTLVLAEKAVNFYGMSSSGEYLGAFADLSDLSGASESITYYRAGQNSDGAVIGTSVILDLNGKVLTNVTVNEGVTLSLVDTANDQYDAAKCGQLSGIINGTVNVLTKNNSKDYVVVNDNGTYSAHRYHRSLAAISLDPTNDALGYKATFRGDAVLSDSIVTDYGFQLWVEDADPINYGKSGYANTDLTLRLKNILAANGGEMAVSGRAYVTFTVNGESYTDYGSTTTTTMKETIQKVNAAWDTYTEAQQTAVKSLCDKYAVTQTWELTNIYPVEETTPETTEPEETVSEA